MSAVLVVVAHPDDEVLGCGGTMARLAQEGRSVHLLVLADGVGARHVDGHTDARVMDEQRRRRAALTAASQVLGVQSVDTADFPDNRMDTVAVLDVARRVEQSIAAHRPTTVLTHHAGDVNQDHRRTHEAVVAACRPQPGHPVDTLLFFEVASSTEWQVPGAAPVFQPSWFVDTSSTITKQLEALSCYAEELRPWPHPRSAEALRARAAWRGATVGVEAAEAFMLGRRLVRG